MSMPMPMPMPNVYMYAMFSMPHMFVHNTHTSIQFANMPFIQNPYFSAFNMPQMIYGMPNMLAP